MFTRHVVALSLILALVSLPTVSPSAVAQNSDRYEEMIASIRKEGLEHSQILKTMHMLTDVYGPRLTGSPNHKRAAEWALKQMTDWGFENAHLEAWDFGHPGWLNERLTAHVISPVKDSLVCEVLAWTPGTRGPVKAKVYHLVVPERPTQEQLNEFFGKEKVNVRARIVLVGKPQVVPVNLTPPTKRAFRGPCFSRRSIPTIGWRMPKSRESSQAALSASTAWRS